MRILGLDLATTPKNTGVVVVDFDDNWTAVASIPEQLNGRTADDDTLVELARDVDVIGVDAPLGWPTAFVAAVTAHHAGQAWTWRDDRAPLRQRRTDHVVKAIAGITALSVSSDKLGATAMRCALLQHRWAEEVWNATAPRDGSGPLVEVYPAATLQMLGLRNTSYKGKGDGAQRTEILNGIQAQFPGIALGGAVADMCFTSDHTLDALVSAIAARDAKTGRSRLPSTEERGDALTEGWIHVRSRSV